MTEAKKKRWGGRVKLDLSRHDNGRKTYRVMHWGQNSYATHQWDWQLTGFRKTWLGARLLVWSKYRQMRASERRKAIANAKRTDFETIAE